MRSPVRFSAKVRYSRRLQTLLITVYLQIQWPGLLPSSAWRNSASYRPALRKAIIKMRIPTPLQTVNYKKKRTGNCKKRRTTNCKKWRTANRKWSVSLQAATNTSLPGLSFLTKASKQYGLHGEDFEEHSFGHLEWNIQCLCETRVVMSSSAVFQLLAY